MRRFNESNNFSRAFSEWKLKAKHNRRKLTNRMQFSQCHFDETFTLVQLYNFVTAKKKVSYRFGNTKSHTFASTLSSSSFLARWRFCLITEHHNWIARSGSKGIESFGVINCKSHSSSLALCKSCLPTDSKLIRKLKGQIWKLLL